MKAIQFKFLCVAVMSFLTMTACQSINVGEPAKGSNRSAAASPKEAAGSADPKAVLTGSMKTLQNLPSWIAEVDTTSDAAPQAAMKMQIQYAAPDSFLIENNAAGNKVQVVAVGGKTYMQMGGKWEEAPSSVNMGQVISDWKQMFSDEKLAAFENIKAAGRETVDGRDLAVYTYEIDQEKTMSEEMKKQISEEAKAKIAEMQAENKGKIWIDEAKNLPVKMEMTTTMTSPQTLTQKMSVKYIYDREVKIEAPKLK